MTADPEPVVVWAVVRPDGSAIRFFHDTQPGAQAAAHRLNDPHDFGYTARRFHLTPTETDHGE